MDDPDIETTWDTRIARAVESWRYWEFLPSGRRMDRAMKEAGFRDLVVDRNQAVAALARVEARLEAAERVVLAARAWRELHMAQERKTVGTPEQNLALSCLLDALAGKDAAA